MTDSDRRSNGPLIWIVGIGLLAGFCLITALAGRLIWLHGVRLSQQFTKGLSDFSQCGINLKQIGLALEQYRDTYRYFPPAYVADANGRPMHSWRVLILPYLGQE